MNLPTLPTGSDVSKRLRAGRSDCQLTVGFEPASGPHPRFLIQLHYRPEKNSTAWRAIARIDHNETAATGHDVYQEGLHVDIDRRTSPGVHLDIIHTGLSASRGTVIRAAVVYLRQYTDYFVDVYEERRAPGAPPRWSDGGEPTREFICANRVRTNMRRESPADGFATAEELSEELAEAEGTTSETIEGEAEKMNLSPRWEADVLEETPK